MNMDKLKNCRCFCHLATPLLVVVLAAVLLLGNMDVISRHLTDILWPIILGVIGLQKLLAGMCRCCKSEHCCHTHEHEHEHTHNHPH